MRYLLDTHTFLWFIHGSDRISKTAKDIIENTENECFVSVATFWELAIKVSNKRLEIGLPFKDLNLKLEENKMSFLPVSLNHCTEVSTLPFHHSDPFDRILISQAMTEELILITKDEKCTLYNIETLW